MKKFTRGLIVFLSYFIFSLLATLPLQLFNINIEKMSLITKTIYLLITDFIFVLILIKVYIKDFKKDFKDLRKNFSNYADEMFKYWLLGLSIMVISNFIITMFSPIKVASNEEAVRSLITNAPFYMAISAAFLTPLTEEYVFRKAFRDFFNTKWLFVFMSAFTFGALHTVTLLESYYELLFIIPYGALGAAFALLYVKTDNLFTPVIMHTVHNTILVLFIFIKG